jgi:hypothetical protein
MLIDPMGRVVTELDEAQGEFSERQAETGATWWWAGLWPVAAQLILTSSGQAGCRDVVDRLLVNRDWRHSAAIGRHGSVPTLLLPVCRQLPVEGTQRTDTKFRIFGQLDRTRGGRCLR